MPRARKIDLLPEELRRWLAEELQERGFADILDITEALNFRLEEEGLALSIGKSAIGEYSQLLKQQRDAFAMAETLLDDLDVSQEADMHKAMMQMIATSTMKMMQSAAGEGREFDTKEIMQLAKALKDMMGSAGIREKMLADERGRIAQEAREAAAEDVGRVVQAQGLSGHTVQAIRAAILGVRDD